jgi:hypothetical protein
VIGPVMTRIYEIRSYLGVFNFSSSSFVKLYSG